MIPTEEALETAFRSFNKRYFSGALPMPKFSVTPLEGMFGYFKPNRMRVKGEKVLSYGNPCGTLYITSSYSRSEMSILNTLLHEMIHMYTFLIYKEYRKDPHSGVFSILANKFNSEGWDIRSENDTIDSDRLVSDGDGEQAVNNWNGLTNGVLDELSYNKYTLYKRLENLKIKLEIYNQIINTEI